MENIFSLVHLTKRFGLLFILGSIILISCTNEVSPQNLNGFYSLKFNKSINVKSFEYSLLGGCDENVLIFSEDSLLNVLGFKTNNKGHFFESVKYQLEGKNLDIFFKGAVYSFKVEFKEKGEILLRRESNLLYMNRIDIPEPNEALLSHSYFQYHDTVPQYRLARLNFDIDKAGPLLTYLIEREYQSGVSFISHGDFIVLDNNDTIWVNSCILSKLYN